MVDNSNNSSSRQQSFIYLIVAAIAFGSLWGLSEVMLGGSLRAANFPYRAGLLTGIGMAVMGMALASSQKLLLPIGIGLIAAMVPLLAVPILGVSIACKANSCIALPIEAGSLSLMGILLAKQSRSSIYARMGMGAGAALASSIGFYFIGTHVAPCNYLLSFNPASFVVTEGLVWSAFSAILLPLGYAAGERFTLNSLALTKNKLSYCASGIVVSIVCVSISAMVISAGF